ncbi:MAG: flagellar biosynthesis protein FliQ [Fimbriimonadaceae bacterium]|jgi:flagellar biosynthetic protein FliQ|nr:flagellar biosynthesis protein FliQ [Fimbriimonadaceae bacterium]
MNESLVLDIARQGVLVGLMVSLPVLAVSLFVGLAVSIFQAVTQVQEMTLTYLPKVVLVAVVVVMSGGWMLTTLVRFTQMCFTTAFQVVQ